MRIVKGRDPSARVFSAVFLFRSQSRAAQGRSGGARQRWGARYCQSRFVLPTRVSAEGPVLVGGDHRRTSRSALPSLGRAVLPRLPHNPEAPERVTLLRQERGLARRHLEIFGQRLGVKLHEQIVSARREFHGNLASG